MSKLKLPNVTLLGIDCVNVERLACAMDVSQKDIEFGAVKLLTSLPTEDSRKIGITHIGSIEDLSVFCIKNLHTYVDTEYVLLVQYDGFVLNPDSWTNEFLQYDYIGAPLWAVKELRTPGSPLFVGNGGFSLRSRKFLEISTRLANEGEIVKFHPEDIALCVWYKDLLEKEGIVFAPVDLAMKFSVVEDHGVYEKPFGFHGLFNKNMDTLIQKYPNFPVEMYLSRRRGKLLDKITKIFEEVAAEGHVLGSVARGDSDIFSDLDVWLTFEDRNVKEVFENRLEYYSQIGDVVHVCEPPQNAPINGIQSFVLYKTKVGLIPVDYYLCPQSTSFVTKESKKLFGSIDLSIGETGLNPQKISVPESYRIDFLICFIFNSIKKIIRKDEQALDALFQQYEYLKDRYNIDVEPLIEQGHTFTTLEKVIENISKIADEKQNRTLVEISNFIKQVK